MRALAKVKIWAILIWMFILGINFLVFKFLPAVAASHFYVPFLLTIFGLIVLLILEVVDGARGD